MSSSSKMECLDDNQREKPVTCYGCGQTLKNYSILICSECFDDQFKLIKSDNLQENRE